LALSTAEKCCLLKSEEKEAKKEQALIFSLFMSGEMSHLCHKTFEKKSFKDSQNTQSLHKGLLRGEVCN